jgi:hypothetical protein
MKNSTLPQSAESGERAAAAVPTQLSISAMNVSQRSELVRWLLSVMMVAQTFEMRTSARTIYDGLVVLSDDIDEIQLCLAFSSALNGDPRFARALKAKGFANTRDEDSKKLTLSFVLGLSGDAGWRDVPEQILVNSTDEKLLRTARIMLQKN